MATASGSPGLMIPSPYDPAPGIPPNMSQLAAMSAGLLRANSMFKSPTVELIFYKGHGPNKGVCVLHDEPQYCG